MEPNEARAEYEKAARRVRKLRSRIKSLNKQIDGGKPDSVKIAAKMLPSLERHLETAEALMKQYEAELPDVRQVVKLAPIDAPLELREPWPPKPVFLSPGELDRMMQRYADDPSLEIPEFLRRT